MSYGKIHGSFWSDEKIVTLSKDAKLVALYLITGPHRSIVGAMRVPLGYMAEDLKFEPSSCRDALAELAKIGFILWDESTSWIHVRNQLLYDPLYNPNHVKAAVRLTAEIGSRSVRDSVIERSISHLRYHNTKCEAQFEHLQQLLKNKELDQIANRSPSDRDGIAISGSGSGSGSVPGPNPNPNPAPRIVALHAGRGNGKSE